VTHVDGSARVQTVDAAVNPRFHALLAAFGRLTGVPVLVNTSFNVRGEPIVCTPTDAYRCFMGTAMDYLVMGPCLLRREDQPPGHPLLAGQRDFEPD
jgi:carbamoyltransferase